MTTTRTDYHREYARRRRAAGAVGRVCAHCGGPVRRILAGTVTFCMLPECRAAYSREYEARRRRPTPAVSNSETVRE